jgi:hypothetical protein
MATAVCVWCGEPEDDESGELTWHDGRLFHAGCLGRSEELAESALAPRPRSQVLGLDRGVMRHIAAQPYRSPRHGPAGSG